MCKVYHQRYISTSVKKKISHKCRLNFLFFPDYFLLKCIHACDKSLLNTYYVLKIAAEGENTVLIKAHKTPALLGHMF